MKAMLLSSWLLGIDLKKRKVQNIGYDSAGRALPNIQNTLSPIPGAM